MAFLHHNISSVLDSKIPVLVDQSDKENPINLFESGSILLYLAEKHNKFVPPISEPAARADVINWLMWQMGTGPYFGQFGHFFRYAPKDKVAERDYGVGRYGMECQRCLSVLDMVLAKSTSGYISNWGYSIADMAIWPWVKAAIGVAKDFIGTDKYENLNAWFERVGERPQVVKGTQVTPFN